MAGGGVKPGFTHGATGEFGYYAVEDRMHVHDLHARRSSTCRASTTTHLLLRWPESQAHQKCTGMSPKKSSVEERRRTMDLTRRELERMVLAGLSTPLFSRASTAGPAEPNSKVRGVQIGAQSYSLPDRGRDGAIPALTEVGLMCCELYAG